MASSPGQPIPELRLTPDKYVTVRYAGASGDFNPIHVDDEFARSVGLPGKILHGLWSMAQVARAVRQAGEPEHRLRRLSVQFRDMAVPEAEIVVRGAIRVERDGVTLIDAEMEQNGRRIIRNAEAELQLPVQDGSAGSVYDGFNLDCPGGRIAVRRWNVAEPRCVAVVVHGYAEHSGRYAHVAEHLAANGAAVYAPDHRGHGLSAGERALIADLDDLVADLGAVIARARAEHPGLPLVVVGHSMGGMIATRYAQLHPGALAALVLSGPPVGGNPALEALLALDPIPEVPIDPGVLSRDPAVGREYAEDPLVWHGPFKRLTLEALFAAVSAIAEGPALIGLPTLWVHGELDQLAPLDCTERAVQRISGDTVERRVYPGAQHEVFNETNREEVLDEVTEFLEATLYD
jgi:alpha-beta hydrolase superfamily lysophospholipase/acyl dehydratase